MNWGVFLFLVLYGARDKEVDANMIACHHNWKIQSVRDKLNRQSEGDIGIAKYITKTKRNNKCYYKMDQKMALHIFDLETMFQIHVKDPHEDR